MNASLSLDLDNHWAYLRTLGPGKWEAYPCYLQQVVPRVEQLLRRFNLSCTVFVVGKDLEFASGKAAVRQLLEAGCEIGNHTYHHYPWLHSLSPSEQRQEVEEAHQAITELVGIAPTGFRGPGFSRSNELLAWLAKLGYAYDSSSLPAVTAPLARLYCAANALWQCGPRNQMFGSWKDGFASLNPHKLQTSHGPITELPVTTMPVLRTPMHMTYVMHLAQYSEGAASAYWKWALIMCRWRNVAPSLLLHPLDFLGAEDCPDLSWFPGMQLKRETKRRLLDHWMAKFAELNVLTCGELARRSLPTETDPTAPHASTCQV